MQLVERHLIRKDDPRFAVIDSAAFASKTCIIKPITKFGNPSSMRGSICRMQTSFIV